MSLLSTYICSIGHLLSRRHIVYIGAIFLLLIAGIGIEWALAQRVIYEMSGGHEGDGNIYMAMGRGMINGYMPYRELFETKPPGMFVISALSVLLFDDLTLGYVLQGLLTALFPFLLLIPFTGTTPEHRTRKPILFMVIAFIAGSALSFYTASISGGFQTESFGAFFITLYAMLIIRNNNNQSIRNVILLSVCLLIGMGLKEPFLIIAMGCAMLLSSSIQSFLLTNFLRPLLWTLLAGGMCMLMLGMFFPYIQVYLPEMLGMHVNIFGSPWVRGLLLEKPFLHMYFFSPFLPLVLILVWIGALPSFYDVLRNSKYALLFLSMIAIAVIAVIVEREVLIRMMIFSNDALLKFLVFIQTILFITGVVLIVRVVNRQILLPLGGRSPFHSLLLHGIVLYLFTFTIGLGGEFVDHHFGFGTPIFATVIILCLQEAERHWGSWSSRLFVGMIIVSLVGFAVSLPSIPYTERLQRASSAVQNTKILAADLDAVLDRCDISQYLFLDAGPELYAFTHHSPMGPGFFQYSLNFPINWREPNLFFNITFATNLTSTSIITRAASSVERPPPAPVLAYINEHFSETPLPCALPYVPTSEYRLLFRKAGKEISLEEQIVRIRKLVGEMYVSSGRQSPFFQ